MKVRTTIKAGGTTSNHNETLARDSAQVPSLKIRTGIKAGGTASNHNETLARDE